MKKQWKPFFEANPHITRLVTNGDRSHPGNGQSQSKAACAWFNENFPNIELMGAENILSHDGKLRSKADREKPPSRKITTKHTTAGHVWIANSPDLNVAEHAVAAIANKTKLGMGSYSQKELTKIAKKRWADYDQASIDDAILGMNGRLAGVIKKKGAALMRGVDY